jgi:translocation and assembly module TamB
MNFDLIRALNGKPFPYDWQGDLIGTVRARGGPVNRFHVEDARVTFSQMRTCPVAG